MGRPSNNQRNAGPAGAPESPQVNGVDGTPPENKDGVVTSGDDGTAGTGGMPNTLTDGAPSIDPDDNEGADGDTDDTDDTDDEGGEEDEEEDDSEDAAPPPPPVKRARAVVEATVAKGRTVQDIDGTNRRPGQIVRVPAADHERLIELGFLAKPSRSIIVPVKKGPSVTRGS